MTARIERAENDAFVTLYRAANECCDTAWTDVDGITVVWSPHDDDPGYSCIINLADADDPAVALARIEDIARNAGATVLGIDGSPGVNDRLGMETLAGLGFIPDYQECMWGRRLMPDEFTDPELPAGLRIDRVTAEQSETFARVLNVGYGIPADAIRGSIFASTIGLPGWTHYLVSFDGQPGSASVLYVSDGVADLFVATTMPEFRGRGAQTALIRQRLADGIAVGCDLATSQTVVDNSSPRNMARYGFQPLYYRWIYGKRLD